MSAEGDRMRRARLEFAEAMERGCTIPELRREKAREEHAAAVARLEARRNCGRPIAGAAIPISGQPRSPFLSEETRNEPWMMRD